MRDFSKLSLNRKPTDMLKEFRDFINKGNVLDLAVAFIMGVSFNPIVKSLVDHIIMPPIGLLLGDMDFSRLKIILREAETGADGAVLHPEVAIQYGLFINAIMAFVITAFAMFLLIKAYNKTKKKEAPAPAAAPPPPGEEVQLLTQIRDLLKK